jgi:hypothetical protein
MKPFLFLVIVMNIFCCCLVQLNLRAQTTIFPTFDKNSTGVVSVVDYFPREYVTDGSVNYQKYIQEAINDAARKGCTVYFPPMIYQLNESGLELRSNLLLWMYGAKFLFKMNCTQDGQAFWGEDLKNVQFFGGEIIGRSEFWSEGINIRGLYLTGKSQKIQIKDIYIHDITSNGIGIFGRQDDPAIDILVTDVLIQKGCNYYGDYLSKRPGPEKDSERFDQGLIAFYYVHNFVVRGSRFEKSRSDGTHFYKCNSGQITQNKIYYSQMGGYFLETCADVLGSDNIMKGNGSRGVTIERGSQNCSLVGCVIESSGREGLWAPDCSGLIISQNIFKYNGRKPNGKKTNQIWNANITINEASHDPTKSPTQDYLISNNIIYTTNSQVAAIRIDANKSNDIIIKNNLLRGENQQILVEGNQQDSIILESNE